jgi:hypothetical protein
MSPEKVREGIKQRQKENEFWENFLGEETKEETSARQVDTSVCEDVQ